MTSQSRSTRRGAVPDCLLFASPLRLDPAIDDHKECPICREPYIDFEPSSPGLQVTKGEWAVSVDLLATNFGLKRCCGHVFGRRCLERHVWGFEPWSTTCPMCRDKWYAENPESSRPQMNASSATTGFQTVQSTASTPEAATQDPISGLAQSNDRRCERSETFIEHILNKLGINNGAESIDATLEEVEEMLEQLYQENQFAK